MPGAGEVWETTENTELSEAGALGEIEVEYPIRMTPGSSNSIFARIQIPFQLASVIPIEVDRVNIPPNAPPIVGEISSFQATILITETMRVELSSPIFTVESLYPPIQAVETNRINTPTTWAWTIVAPGAAGKQVLTVRVYLGNNDAPSWIRSLEIEVVEASSAPVSFIDRPVGIAMIWISGIALIAAIIFVGVLMAMGRPLNSLVAFSEEGRVKNKIVLHQRRLQKLEEQAARQGANVEPEISMEIEDIETELERLQARLAEVRKKG